MTKTLNEFLEYKTLYYEKIDYEVIKKAWKQLETHITLPFVIHIVGTNGKGSTGRFLASFLNQLNKKVLHYTSPHIIEFNERIWINGSDSSSDKLDSAHLKLQKLLDNKILEKLTYFEYTTLLALILSDGLDYLVLEAGLGGEFDATNVVKNNLSIFTPIGLDHQEFLGDTIKDIATTKLKSCDSKFIISQQVSDEVYQVKDDVLKDKIEIKLENIKHNISNNLPKYLEQNLNTALNVIRYLQLSINDLYIPHLFGRFEKIAPNITIDVGHNTLASKAIVEELIKSDKKISLIYNSYKNKDYKNILTMLKPIVKSIMIIPCNDDRIVNQKTLEEIINSLAITVKAYDIMKLDDKEDYLVFGSFIVVEQFLKGYKQYEKR